MMVDDYIQFGDFIKCGIPKNQGVQYISMVESNDLDDLGYPYFIGYFRKPPFRGISWIYHGASQKKHEYHYIKLHNHK
jgi:hypothetical protein